MRRKGVDRMAQHSRAAERQILLWQIAAKPCASAGGNDQGAGCGHRVNVCEGRPYSLSTLSAHSTSITRSGGVTKRAFLPSRSVSRTARAREQAVQMLSGIRCAIVFGMISDSGGQPTGVTEAIISSFIRLTASPSRKMRTSCPASAKALAWRKAKAAFVGSSDPHALLINTLMPTVPPDGRGRLYAR